MINRFDFYAGICFMCSIYVCSLAVRPNAIVAILVACSAGFGILGATKR